MGLGMFAGEVFQFMESPEYNRFTHIVFDTAPTLKKKITAAASAFTSVFDKKEMQQQGPGGAHNPDDDKHGKKCASSKFHFGVSSGCNPSEGGDKPKEPSDAEGTIPNSEQ
ncbi:unnamed protein product [Brassica oleracea]